jgi:TPR repeat protein
MALMGVCHAMGRDVAKDEVKAVEWFRQSASKGNGEAALALGLWTLEGKGGLQPDPVKAAELLEVRNSSCFHVHAERH